jgi:hypothetical protein
LALPRDFKNFYPSCSNDIGGFEVFFKSNTAMSIQKGMDNAFCRLRWLLWLPVGLGCLTQAGCMSAITSAALRDALRDTVTAASEPAAAVAGEQAAITDDDASEATLDDGLSSQQTAPTEPTLSLDEAVERAVERLSGIGQLDAATQTTLLAMLESTNPEDWPAAIDAFAAALEANRPRQPPVTQTAAELRAEPEPDPVELAAAPAPVVTVAVAVTPTVDVVPAVAVTPAVDVTAAVLDSPAPFAEDEPAETETPAPERLQIEPQPDPIPELTIRNPCFVTRVRAWGAVDRFPEQVFRPGQDVIVYFELEDLSSRASAAGHATSIDAMFRLIATDGQQTGQWKFEPVEETCHAPRSDYFARYFIRIPETAPAGRCKLEFMVTDRFAGVSTQAHLDLEIVDAK